jgi:hypothetical protein
MFKAARGQFDGEAGGSGGWGHYLRVGDHKIWLALPSKIRLRAAAIAAAGSARPEALPAA